MTMPDTLAQNIRPKPYQPLKEDPKFEQIRRLIKNFPRDKMINLKEYIRNLEKS